MQYKTKRQRITNYLNSLFSKLKEANKTADMQLLIATTSLELGIRESDIKEVIQTFQDANLIEIKDGELFV